MCGEEEGKVHHGRKLTTIAAILAATFLFSIPLNAVEWIDNWFSSATTYGGYTPGSHGQSQQRGFASAGSFSLRNVQPTPDTFISVQTPRINVGCGGIDILGGSVQYLRDPALLMQKAQAIISGALYIGFELALSTLNEQLVTTYRSAESTINALNSLAINDCATSKTIAVSTASAMKGNWEEAGNAWTAWSEDSGGTNLYRNAKTLFKGTNAANPGTSGSTPGGVPAIAASCGADLRNLVSTNSMLRTLLQPKGYDNDQINLIRGLFGDYAIDVASVDSFMPCSLNSNRIMDVFLEGQGQKMTDNPTAGACEAMGNGVTINGRNYADLKTWARTNLNEIATAMRNKTALSADNIYFIDAVPFPVYIELRDAIIQGSEAMAVERNADMAAKGYIFKIVSSMEATLANAVMRAERIISAQQAGDSSCSIPSLDNVIPALNDLRARMLVFRTEAYEEYQAAMTEYGMAVQQTDVMQRIHDGVMKNIGKAFNTSLAARLK